MNTETEQADGIDSSVFSGDQFDAMRELAPEAQFVLSRLQSAAAMSYSLVGASVFMLVVVPVSEDKARMMTFSAGCDCVACTERSNELSRKFIEIGRDVSAEQRDRIIAEHERINAQMDADEEKPE